MDTIPPGARWITNIPQSYADACRLASAESGIRIEIVQEPMPGFTQDKDMWSLLGYDFDLTSFWRALDRRLLQLAEHDQDCA